MILCPIGHIHSGFETKFGIPRQSNLARTYSEVILEGEFAVAEAVRGLEEFDYIWLIWQFSANLDKGWSPTVRPPRLGGNRRVGVFASRSPFRPNSLGLSCVRLLGVEIRPGVGPVLRIQGADLMDGTPVFDIKPYIAETESHPEGAGGFTDRRKFRELEVEFSPAVRESADEDLLGELGEILRQDPRPQYQDDRDRIYGMVYRGRDVRFQVEGDRLRVVEIRPV